MPGKTNPKAKRQGKKKADSKALVRQHVPKIAAAYNKLNQVSARVKAMAYMVLNPSGANPVRLAFAGDEAFTSLVQLNLMASITYNTVVGTYATAGISSSTGMFHAFYFKDPLRFAVVFKPNTAAFSYKAVYPNVLGVSTTQDTQAAAGATTPLVPIYFTPQTGSAKPHGDYLYCAYDDETRIGGYFWADAGSVISITQGLAKTSDSIRIYNLEAGNDTPVSDQLFAATTVTYTVAGPSTLYRPERGGYFRVVYVNGAAPATGQTVSVSVGTSAASDVFAHMSMPGVEQHLNQLSRTRVNAASMLLRNVAAQMYNEGSIQAAAFVPDTDWRTQIGNAQLVNAVSSQNAYSGSLRQGSYSFLKFTGQQDTDFYDYTLVNPNGIVMECSYPLHRSQYIGVTAVTAAIGNVGSPTFPGLDLLVHGAGVLEFQTNDQWFDARTHAATSIETLQFTDLVAREIQFFENPSHLSKITNFLASAGRTVKTHAGKIGSALAMLFPQYASWIAPLATAVSNM